MGIAFWGTDDDSDYSTFYPTYYPKRTPKEIPHTVFKWYPLEQIPDLTAQYLLLYASGIICSGRYRYGKPGEPMERTLAWRMDCCGKPIAPTYWTKMPETP